MFAWMKERASLGAVLALLPLAYALPAVKPSQHDHANYTWTRHPLIGQGPRQEHSVTALGDDIYVIGGVNYNEKSQIQTLNQVQFYNVKDDTWHVAAPLPQPLNHANAAAVGGKIFVLGALNADANWTAVPDSYVYHPSNDTWLDVPHMPNKTARGASAVGVFGTKVYIAGGMTILEPRAPGIQNSVATVSSFDVDTGAWDDGDDLPALPEPRQHVGGAVVGTTFYVIGGRENGIEQYHNTTYALDLADPSASWRTLAAMPTARGSLACSALGPKIFCFGGEGNPDNWQKIFNETEVYDTRSDSWERLPPMEVPRHGTGAATVGDRIYVVGGGATTAMFPIGIVDSLGPA